MTHVDLPSLDLLALASVTGGSKQGQQALTAALTSIKSSLSSLTTKAKASSPADSMMPMMMMMRGRGGGGGAAPAAAPEPAPAVVPSACAACGC